MPKTGEGIIDLIGQVQRVYEQQEEEGPITVHCSDGVGRTGVFCALGTVLERMRSEGVVDLFQTVKLLRTQRPGMVQTQVRRLPLQASLALSPSFAIDLDMSFPVCRTRVNSTARCILFSARLYHFTWYSFGRI